jgi:hypothetical protein
MSVFSAQSKQEKEAVIAERRRRTIAEEKRKQSELTAKAVEAKRQLREACANIYHRTVDKKVKDLTVGEEQQVRSC